MSSRLKSLKSVKAETEKFAFENKSSAFSNALVAAVQHALCSNHLATGWGVEYVFFLSGRCLLCL